MWKELLLHFQQHIQKLKVLLFANRVFYCRVWKNAFFVTWQDVLFSVWQTETCYFYIKTAIAPLYLACQHYPDVPGMVWKYCTFAWTQLSITKLMFVKFQSSLSCPFAKCTQGRKGICHLVLPCWWEAIPGKWCFEKKAVLSLALNLPSNFSCCPPLHEVQLSYFWACRRAVIQEDKLVTGDGGGVWPFFLCFPQCDHSAAQKSGILVYHQS